MTTKAAKSLDRVRGANFRQTNMAAKAQFGLACYGRYHLPQANVGRLAGALKIGSLIVSPIAVLALPDYND